jgi:hypothetical protein
MKLEKVALLAEIIGGVAIVLSLIYVGYQINQNTQQMRLEAFGATVTEQNNLFRMIAADEALADLIRRAELDPDSLNDTEKIQIYYFIRAFLWVTEADFSAMENGLIDDYREPLADFWGRQMSIPVYREYWVENRWMSSPGVREFMDSLAESAP